MILRSFNIRSDSFPQAHGYPFDVPALHLLGPVHLDTAVTCFVGENGSGKSTLLRALARACRIHIWGETESGRRIRNPWEKRLCEFIDLDWTPSPGAFFASETFRNFALLLEEWSKSDPGQLKYFGGDSLITRSHGQSHMAFFRNRFRIPGLYLLDEPENALSPARQLELLELLAQCREEGSSQFILCTHSTILMSLPGSRILDFNGSGLREIPFRETPHFRLTRDFFRSFDE